MADLVILPTREDHEYLGTTLDRAVVVPNSIDDSVFRPVEQSGKTAQSTARRALFVGRLEEQKQPAHVLIAAELMPDWSFTIVGDGSLREALQRRSPTNVEFRGMMSNSDVARAMREHDVLLLPSLAEGQPKVVLEAMASGLPPVAYSRPEMREIVRHGEDGLLIDSNPRAMVEALRMLDDDNHLLASMSSRARENVVRKHTMAVCASREAAAIRTTLTGRTE